MKCHRYKEKMERTSNAVATADSKVPLLKAPPVSPQPSPVKPKCPPTGADVKVLFSINNNTGTVHNKENSTNRDHDGTMDEGFEDSGYLSLHNSQIDDHHGDEEDHIQRKIAVATHQGKNVSPKSSPSKCQGKTNSSPVCPLKAFPSVGRHSQRTATYSLSSTPSSHFTKTNLPILKFQEAVCEELAKGYQKNKRYDWSIVSKVAEDHLLDRVIGGQIGCEYVDMFSSLLSRNMKNILINILALLGDMDLISCKKVSRTWRMIIHEDIAALNRCHRAEQALRESMTSLRKQDCGLTRDVAVSRVVLSCMQTLASSSTPPPSSSSSSFSSSSSTPGFRINRRTAPSQKSGTPSSQCTRFNEYVQAASNLKRHESLRPCRRCGSPATHLAEAQRATCTRPSCLFNFCTHCQEAFHGSTPCRAVQPRPHFSGSKSTPLIPGSARSKRSVRRL